MKLEAQVPLGDSAVVLEIADLSDELRVLGLRANAFRQKIILALIGGVLAMVLAVYALATHFTGCSCEGPPSIPFIFFCTIGLVGGLALALFAIYNWAWGLSQESRRMERSLQQSIDKLKATT